MVSGSPPVSPKVVATHGLPLSFGVAGNLAHAGRSKPLCLFGGTTMQPRVDINLSIDREPDRWVHSACILCSNGCGQDIAVADGRIVGVRGIVDHPVSFGHLGPKGENGWIANNSDRRGTTPMIR